MARPPSFSKVAHFAHSSQEARSYLSRLKADARSERVNVNFTVTYDPITHDMILEAFVKVVEADDNLLQVWLTDDSTELGIPETLPWVSGVVEFEAEQAVKKAHVGLFDSKWRRQDEGTKWIARLSGYLAHKGEVEHFHFEKEFIYPKG